MVGLAGTTWEAFQVFSSISETQQNENRTTFTDDETGWYYAMTAQWYFYALNSGLWTAYNLDLTSEQGLLSMQKWNPVTGFSVALFLGYISIQGSDI